MQPGGKGKGVKAGKGGAGARGKKMAMDCLPSPMAQRVIPVIAEDLKKRVEKLTAAKENKGKRVS